MPSELQQNRYDQLLRRVGGMIGAGSKVSEVLTELFPMFDVENMPMELLRLSGTRVAFGGGQINAIVGQSGTAQLFNPVGSGHLVTLTSVNIAGSKNSVVRWGVTAASRGSRVGTEQFRDTRDLAPQEPVALVQQETSATLADGSNQSRILPDTNFTIFDLDGITVLAPGTGFEIGLDSNDQPLNYSIFWRERVAEQSELQF